MKAIIKNVTTKPPKDLQASKNSSKGEHKIVQQKLNLLEEHQKLVKSKIKNIKCDQIMSTTPKAQETAKITLFKNSRIGNPRSYISHDFSKQKYKQNHSSKSTPESRKYKRQFSEEEEQNFTTVYIQLNASNLKIGSTEKFTLDTPKQHLQRSNQNLSQTNSEQIHKNFTKYSKLQTQIVQLNIQQQKQDSLTQTETQHDIKVMNEDNEEERKFNFNNKQTQESNAQLKEQQENEEELISPSKLAKAQDISQKELQKHQQTKQNDQNIQIQIISAQMDTPAHLRSISSSNFMQQTVKKVRFNLVEQIIPWKEKLIYKKKKNTNKNIQLKSILKNAIPRQEKNQPVDSQLKRNRVRSKTSYGSLSEFPQELHPNVKVNDQYSEI